MVWRHIRITHLCRLATRVTHSHDVGHLDVIRQRWLLGRYQEDHSDHSIHLRRVSCREPSLAGFLPLLSVCFHLESWRFQIYTWCASPRWAWLRSTARTLTFWMCMMRWTKEAGIWMPFKIQLGNHNCLWHVGVLTLSLP